VSLRSILYDKSIHSWRKMKRKFLPIVSLVLMMALAACGPKSAPGLSAADVQNTAVAHAMTAIGMTQAVMPTNTPALPTPILPTLTTEGATLVTLPTVAVATQVSAPVNNSNASPTPDCYQPPAAKLLGTTVQVKLVNKSDGPVNLSMGMYEPNDKGECFTWAFSVNDKGSETVTVLSGCYWIAGYQNGPNPSTPRVGYICLTDTTQIRGLTINNNSIGFD
jgi:predicted small lipoprotein YifL